MEGQGGVGVGCVIVHIKTEQCTANAVLDSSTGFKDKHQDQASTNPTKKRKIILIFMHRIQ